MSIDDFKAEAVLLGDQRLVETGRLMAIYVDDAAVVWKGKKRFHLGATSVDELHRFADSIGINRCWFHAGARHPHYDVTESQRAAALLAGAQAVTSRELVRIYRATTQRKELTSTGS